MRRFTPASQSRAPVTAVVCAAARSDAPREIAGCALMHPAHHLAGTEGFFPHLGEMGGEAGEIVVEQVGFHYGVPQSAVCVQIGRAHV